MNSLQPATESLQWLPTLMTRLRELLDLFIGQK
jgi:hypothetical protein